MKITKATSIGGADFWLSPDNYELGYEYGQEKRRNIPSAAFKWPEDCPFWIGYRDAQGDEEILKAIEQKKEKFLSKNLRAEKQAGRVPPSESYIWNELYDDWA